MWSNYTDGDTWFTVFGVFFPTVTGVLSGINIAVICEHRRLTFQMGHWPHSVHCRYSALRTIIAVNKHSFLHLFLQNISLLGIHHVPGRNL